jgi:hypothetical protein
MDEFYRAKEDDTQVYHRVCAGESDDIDEHTNASIAAAPAGMARALSALKCTGDTPSEWRKKRQEYIKKFTKAKKCLQRRLTTMKKYSATNAIGRSRRVAHIHPIQYAYAYGKGCLKKFAGPAHQEAFKQSVNDLIRKVAAEEKSSNISGYFSPSGSIDIDESIIRGNNPSIREILLERIPYNRKELNRSTIHGQAEIAADWAADAKQIADKWNKTAVDAAALLHQKRATMSKNAADKMGERIKQIRHDADRLKGEADLAAREAEMLKIEATSKKNLRELSGKQSVLTTRAQERAAIAASGAVEMSGWGRKQRRKTHRRYRQKTKKN